MGVCHTAYYQPDGCNCENIRFDVDEFGRVWYPDLMRFRFCVLDTNGNEIMHAGRYGNAESAGLEIAFAWINGVGATDRYIYANDIVNRRLMRLKQVYAAEEICEVK